MHAGVSSHYYVYSCCYSNNTTCVRVWIRKRHETKRARASAHSKAVATTGPGGLGVKGGSPFAGVRRRRKVFLLFFAVLIYLASLTLYRSSHHLLHVRLTGKYTRKERRKITSTDWNQTRGVHPIMTSFLKVDDFCWPHYNHAFTTIISCAYDPT